LARIAVVIATAGRKKEPLRLINSLSQQTRIPNQIIIAAGDDTLQPDDIPSAGIQVTFLKVVPPGLPRQRNLGASKSTADLLLFVDDDFVLDVDYLRAMEQEFSNNPTMVAAGGQTIGVRKPRLLVRSMQHFFGLTRLACRSYLQKTGFPGLAYGMVGKQQATVLSGSNLMVRRNAWQQTQFDESLTGYAWMEDDDFTYRAAKLGELWEIPAAKGEHRMAAGRRGKRDVRQEARMRAQNHRYLHGKLLGNNLWLRICRLWGQLGMICFELVIHHDTKSALGFAEGAFSRKSR
jgi:glucosyl-dolichyl phosphate glucuronosyltransferase